jgi:hypothetical protein
MPDDLWFYDIRRILLSYVNSFLDELQPDDETSDELAPDEKAAREEARAIAHEKVMEVLPWLHGAPGQPIEEFIRRIEEGLLSPRSIAAQVRQMVQICSSCTGKSPGRPRRNGPVATHALFLHFTTNKSWREITFEIKGPCRHICVRCNDTKRLNSEPSGLRTRAARKRCQACESTIRAKTQQVCSKCADATRASVGLLEPLLRRLGLYPMLPRVIELTRMSEEQLMQWLSANDPEFFSTLPKG